MTNVKVFGHRVTDRQTAESQTGKKSRCPQIPGGGGHKKWFLRIRKVESERRVGHSGGQYGD